jgi:hypothetical protein
MCHTVTVRGERSPGPGPVCGEVVLEMAVSREVFQGILEAAVHIANELKEKVLLAPLFAPGGRAEGWKVIVTGHSLGAGTAALLALLLRSQFPDLVCWAFSPPGALVSRRLAEYVGVGDVCVCVCHRELVSPLTSSHLTLHLFQTL